MRADFGITYDADALKLIDDLRDRDLAVRAVVITRYDGQPAAAAFKQRLERRGVQVHTHAFTRGYPTDVDLIVSDQGYGANTFVQTDKPLVVVTGPGPGSGKLATCLSQLYHEHRRGVDAGYAKFETFPIWDLPLKHPVNVAYEAATADLRDVNMIDSFHLEAYGRTAVNYNRDVEAFPLLSRILTRIQGGEPPYRSPTDMGVNRAGLGIVDDGVVRGAAVQEVIRRYFRYACEYALGLVDKETVQRAELLVRDLGAREHVAGIPDALPLLAPSILESITRLKSHLGLRSASLDLEETLTALAISATTNPAAQLAIDRLTELRGCEAHMTHIPTPGDEAGLRRLGVNLTSDPHFSSKSLFVG